MENYTGKRLDGRYEIHEVIGVGGMAVVYKAYDNIDDRIVSVKILKEEYLANQEFRRRFKNESKAIAVLSHPNIVKVYDVSYGDRLQYIVMEYVEGITLKEYIEQQGKLEIREAVHFIMQILCALQHAHDMGIVHRDIKPQNIMLLSNGNIKVMDFGIAHFSCSETKTMTDSAIGSVHYISPEQARGDTTNDKTDIYSAGVVLYEMLTGRVPFESDNTVSVALMQLSKDPKRPREINSNIPVGLEQIVMHAMQKNMADRYQSAAEMLLDIEELKRNPSVRFKENYFVDKSPTKAIPTAAIKAVAMPSINGDGTSAAPAANIGNQVLRPDSTVEINRGKSTVLGIIIGLVIVLVLAFVSVIVNPAGVIPASVLDVARNIPVIGSFVGTKVTVPNFINLDYEDDVVASGKYSDYQDIIKVEFVSNSAFLDGHVYKQEPGAGSKIDITREKITLYVAQSVVYKSVPDVVNMYFYEAEPYLVNEGFKVVQMPELDLTHDFGIVTKTSPEVGSDIEEGGTVTIYYASDTDACDVPDLYGKTVEEASEQLKSLGLELDMDYTEEESEEKAGLIISQSKKEGEKALPGEKIQVVVSSGNATVTVTIKLPTGASGTSGDVKVYLNNELQDSQTLLLNGNTHSFTVKGDGKFNEFNVLIDGTDYYSCNIDFTSQKPVSKENYSTARSGIRAKMPSVTNDNLDKANATLTSLGFKNINVVKQKVSDSSQDNIVLKQEPAPSGDGLLATTYSVDTKITLTVGEFKDENTTDNND